MNKESLSSAEQEALMFASDLFKDKLPAQYLYHDYNHTLETISMCQEMAEHYQLKEDDKHMLLIASIFHDTGHIIDYKNHESESANIAKTYLKEKKYPPVKVTEIVKLILSTRYDQQPMGLLEEILHDADIINLGKKNFFNKGNLLRMEWEFFLNRHYSDEEWENLQFEFLSSHKFLTTYAQEKYGQRRLKNIEKQKEIINLSRKVNKKEKKAGNAGRGVETMYRSTYRNHINLSSIADNKANMMISINTIIMSVIITIAGSGFTFSNSQIIQHLRFGIPIGLLLLTCLVSVIFAIFSARPSITRKNSIPETSKNDTSLLFFGNFTHMPLSEYIQNMDTLMTDQKELYHSMSIDIYYLGKVLQKKNNLLRSSYNIFMVGLVISVLTFIAIFIYTSAQP